MTWSLEPELVAEIISSILGLTSTYLLTKGDGRGWALGAAMALFMGYVYLTERLFGSCSIQLVFLCIQSVGFYKWKVGADSDLTKSAKRFTGFQLFSVALLWLALAGASGLVLSHYGGSLPYLDGLGTTGNILAQLTLMAGRPECWLFYMVTNLFYIGINYLSGLYVYTVLYCVYMTVATRGWIHWTRAAKEVEARALLMSQDGTTEDR